MTGSVVGWGKIVWDSWYEYVILVGTEMSRRRKMVIKW